MNLLFVWLHVDYAAKSDSVGIVRAISHHLCKMNCVTVLQLSNYIPGFWRMGLIYFVILLK